MSLLYVEQEFLGLLLLSGPGLLDRVAQLLRLLLCPLDSFRSSGESLIGPSRFLQGLGLNIEDLCIQIRHPRVGMYKVLIDPGIMILPIHLFFFYFL